MTKHVHFDLDGLRHHLSREADALADAAMDKTRDGLDSLYVQTQRLFSHAHAEMIVRTAEAENAGTPEEMIVQSAAMALGKMAHSLRSRFGERAALEIIQAFADGMNLAAEQPNNEEFSSVTTAYSPMQGSRA